MWKIIFRNRGYLPHVEVPNAAYFITLRLADTLPATLLDQIRIELLQLKRDLVNNKLKQRSVRIGLNGDGQSAAKTSRRHSPTSFDKHARFLLA